MSKIEIIKRKSGEMTLKTLLYKNKQYNYYTTTLLLKELSEKMVDLWKKVNTINYCISLSENDMIEEIEVISKTIKEIEKEIQIIMDFFNPKT